MFVVTSEQMRRLDEETIKRFVPGLTLMERAGQGVFDALAEFADEISELRAAVFLGRGNNAGDGLVAARLLAEAGATVVLLYLHESDELSPDAYKNYARLDRLRSSGKIEEVLLYHAGWEDKTVSALQESDVLIDALLGTGINSPVRENYAAAIELINGSGLPVLSIDVPSGVNGTSGAVMGNAVAADLTVTMGLPKTGAVFYPGKAFNGSLEVIDIGIPREVIAEAMIDTHILDHETALADLPHHRPDTHKFERGALLVVAGSRRFAGAAQLAAVSALRTGCGIVYLAGPPSIRTVIQTAAPEIIFVEVPETASGSIAPAALGVIENEVRFDAAAIGPGMTTDEETSRFVRECVSAFETPLLIDADGLNAFEGAYQELRALSLGRPVVVSPHSGELRRLTGGVIPLGPEERFEALHALVEGASVTLVHKGAPTVIAHPDGRIDVNVFGHPGLATAGSGDVLTGAIGGLLAQGASTAEAARLGVYIHSRAAEIAAEDLGERGMVAGDCSEALPAALRELEDELAR
jgi:ADP-dependent NAD(P)H-hydrate dehydratase / NAD(P)H-hydrate epimerase